MKNIAAIFVITCVILGSRASGIDDALRYMDEVLSVYVPQSIEEFGLTVYELPNFSYNYQNRSHDGRATTGKIYFHSGNITGLQNVHKKNCRDLLWNYSNRTFHCNLVFPQISIKYQAKLHQSTSLTNKGTLRKLDFNVIGNNTYMEALINITSSPHFKAAAIKNMIVSDIGKFSFRLTHAENLPNESIMAHFYHKYNEIFQNVFYDKYRKAFQKAVESVPFPNN